MSEAGPSVGASGGRHSLALAGSRWLVMKNSVQSLTLEMRRRRVAVGSRRKSRGKGRGGMRGRWETSRGEED